MSGAVHGARNPTFHACSPYATSAGAEAVELAARAGIGLRGWQVDTVTEWLAESPDGAWTHPEALLLVPRQNGKTFVLAVRALAGLLLIPGEKNLLYSAHNMRTASEFFRMLTGLAESVPFIQRRVKAIRKANGQEGLMMRDGSMLRIMARTNNLRATFRGFSPDLVMLDEALVLGDDAWSAILPTISARPNPQIILASSAGDGDSTVLARFRDRVRSGSAPGLSGREWAAGADDDLNDPATWAVANPELGGGLTVAAVRRERASMTDDAFGRERCGVWSINDVVRALPVTDFAAAVEPRLDIGAHPVVSVDVHKTTSGERHAAVVLSWISGDVTESLLWRQSPGVAWLAETLNDVVARYHAEHVYMSIGGAQDVAEQLTADGVELRPLKSAEWKACAPGLAQGLTDRTVKVQAAGPLAEAAAAAVAKVFADQSWQFDPRSETPLCGLVAWAVGVWAARAHQPAEYDVLESIL